VPLTLSKNKEDDFVCSHNEENIKRKYSMHCCIECDVGLCVTPYFKISHTQK